MKRIGFLAPAAIALTGFASDLAQDWTRYVRIAGHGLSLDRVEEIVRRAAESHVYGIETDNDITGRYESFLDPAEKLKAIRAMAEKAHAAGNKAFVYIAGTECITSDADKKPHTFFKDHPGWVQRKITGEPAVFGGGSAFWIAPGDEDVWISPYAAEWRKIYMERVRQIAATGIDGVYVDIPYWMTHFNGWEDSWASFDDSTLAAFKAKTGLDAKKDVRLGDVRDAGFRKWIDFRIETLTGFIHEIDQNVKSVNPRCKTIPEIYPGIESEAVRIGADVYEMYRVSDAIAHEYEFEGGAATAASKTPLHWLQYMIGMYSFRAFAEGKASWMLSYSWDGEKDVRPSEAMKNLFAAQLMAGTNSWDAATHVMSGSNDLAARKEIFGWIEAHEKKFYRPRLPVQPVGVYFSPRTRNYFPGEFTESYLGTMALLMHSHLAFQIVTPRTLRAFAGEVLILPDARCLGEEELRLIEKRLEAGKHLIFTADSGKFDELGEPRDAVRRLRRPGAAYAARCPGREYWRMLAGSYDQAAGSGGALPETAGGAFLAAALRGFGYQPEVQISASPFVTAEIARVDGKPHVFLANFRGLRAKVNSVQIPEREATVSFPATRGTRVYALPYLGRVEELKGQRKDGRLVVSLPPIHKGMVVWAE